MDDNGAKWFISDRIVLVLQNILVFISFVSLNNYFRLLFIRPIIHEFKTIGINTRLISYFTDLNLK